MKRGPGDTSPGPNRVPPPVPLTSAGGWRFQPRGRSWRYREESSKPLPLHHLRLLRPIPSGQCVSYSNPFLQRNGVRGCLCLSCAVRTALRSSRFQPAFDIFDVTEGQSVATQGTRDDERPVQKRGTT